MLPFLAVAILRDVEGLGRFERGEIYSQAPSVTSYRGVDTLTGLDVLIYEFQGPGHPAVERLRSDHVLGVLASTHEGGVTRLAVAYPPGGTLVAPGESVVDDEFVLQALEGLRDAHRAGLYHGDLKSGRVLYAGGDVFLEGFGAPWSGAWPSDRAAAQEAALTDIRGLLSALLGLATDHLSSEVKAVLKGALAGSTPPPTAERLHSLVWRLVGGAVTVPSSGFTDLTLPLDAVTAMPPGSTASPAASGTGSLPAEAAKQQPQQRAPQTPPRRPPPPARPRQQPQQRQGGPTRNASSDPFDEPPRDPEPITLHSDPGLGIPSGSPKPASAFVKDLPPGATYRHGNLEDSLRPAPFRLDRDDVGPGRRRSFRGPALLLLLLLVAGFAAYLTFVAREGREPVAGTTPVNHVVDVRIAPSNMPPVELFVDASPSGSAIAAGTLLGPAPRRYTFDANGRWTVHAEIQGRRSGAVTFELPGTANITLTFPPAAAGGP